MQFIFAPMWSLSDRYGRKRSWSSALGFGLSQLLFGLATELWMLFAARSLPASVSATPRRPWLISDSTTRKPGRRHGHHGRGDGRRYDAGRVSAVCWHGSRSTPFFVAAGLAAVAAILIATVLPGSLPERRDRAHRARAAAPEMWHALTGPNAILFVMASCSASRSPTTRRVQPVRWAVRLRAAARGDHHDDDRRWRGHAGLITGGHAPLGRSNRHRVSLLATAIGFVAMTLATDYWTVAATTLFFILSNSMLRPAVASLTSQRAEDGQGVAMGHNSFMVWAVS